MVEDLSRKELIDLVVTASRGLVGMAVRSIDAAAVPVTVSQHRVLVLLAGEGAMTVGEIADLAGVNQSNASRLCDRLQKLGLVGRQRGAEDGRVVRVSLTEQGRVVVDSVTDVRRREVAELLERLPPEDVQKVVSALVILNEATGERDDRTWRAGA